MRIWEIAEESTVLQVESPAGAELWEAQRSAWALCKVTGRKGRLQLDCERSLPYVVADTLSSAFLYLSSDRYFLACKKAWRLRAITKISSLLAGAQLMLQTTG